MTVLIKFVRFIGNIDSLIEFINVNSKIFSVIYNSVSSFHKIGTWLQIIKYYANHFNEVKITTYSFIGAEILQGNGVTTIYYPSIEYVRLEV